AADFFGKEELTQRLVACLGENRPYARFLAVVGPSGSGKSSLVKAGLVPALRHGALPGSANWFIVKMVPGSHPYEELEIGLLRIATNPSVRLMELLRRDERGILQAARLGLPFEEGELLLIIDQFEEIFTLAVDQGEARQFLESLYVAVTEPRSPLRVVITLRADFFDRPLMVQGLSTLLQERTEVVVPLSVSELERAIRSPAQRVGVEVEPVLVTAIVVDVMEQPGALPLLQYALTELFERRQDQRLTLEAYQAIGGVGGALDRRAEQVFTGLSDAGMSSARQVFLRLITPGKGASAVSLPTPDSRRRILKSELETIGIGGSELAFDLARQAGDSTSAIAEAIESFGSARLLSFDSDAATRSPTVEIAHEFLLSEWQRLRGWLEESRGDMRVQRALGYAAGEWSDAGRDPSFLLHGARLSYYEDWAANTDLVLTRDERLFLDASLADRQAQQAADEARKKLESVQKRRMRVVFLPLVLIFFLAALGFLLLAWNAR
ncbi:MAG: nSTAND1 domain-containing NTPase, partial [Anaerolineales bacterium]